MKHLCVIGLSVLCLHSIASARKWTDTQGRTIEAEIVRADADSVTVLTAGREVKIPLQCADEGWVCFAYDSNLGRPMHDQDLVSAVAKMNKVWPQFKQWKFVSGGFSGGWGKRPFGLRRFYSKTSIK